MGKALPTEIDDYFIIGTILTFLILNYNLNLGSIYSHMTLWLVLMYFVPVAMNLFRWTPIIKKGGWTQGLLWGIGAGVAFIFFYNSYIGATLGDVFATTAFGDARFMGQLVYGLLIAIIETIFFFRVLPQWFAWKMGYSFESIRPFSKIGLQLMIFFPAIFTIFHATAKGISNTPELIASFTFGVVSLILILQFKQYIEAIIMHIIVNSKGVGLIDDIQVAFTSGALISNPWFLIAGGSIGVYYLYSKGKIRIPAIF